MCVRSPWSYAIKGGKDYEAPAAFKFNLVFLLTLGITNFGLKMNLKSGLEIYVKLLIISHNVTKLK